MLKNIKALLPKALIIFVVFTIICGIVYPLLITGLGQLIFPKQANGSIIEVNGKKYGSELLGQQYTTDNYMWGRIMNIDTKTFKDKNGQILMYAEPANLSPASREYQALIAERVQKLQAHNPQMKKTAIPVDLVTCSGSGLDPHISVAAAQYQIARIAQTRGISEQKVSDIVIRATDNKLLGIFGEKTVNVLQVNLLLDNILN